MTTSPHTSTAMLLIVVGLILVCSTVLSATGSPIPPWFDTLATVAIGGAAGVAVGPVTASVLAGRSEVVAVAQPPAPVYPAPPYPVPAPTAPSSFGSSALHP